MIMRFCYKIDKKAELSFDKDNNPADTYICVKMDVYKDPLPREQFNTLREKFKKLVIRINGVDSNLIIPVTLNEYLNNTDKDM